MKGFLRLFALATVLFGALAPASAQNVPPTEMLEHWRRATVSLGRLVTERGEQHFTTLGSAVLAAVDDHHACVLTAKHMVDDPNQNPPWKPSDIQLRLARSATSPDPDLGVKISLVANGQLLWKSLAGSDLAVLPLPDMSRYTDLHAVLINDFGSSEDDVFQGAPIVVLGYPGVIGEAPLSFPIARSGIIAWTDPVNRLDRPFLVDANVMPGNSGGPVFHLRTGLNRVGGFVIGGGLALIGIVSQGPLQRVQIGIPPTLNGPAQVLQFQLAGIGGIGVIEPASKAKALVQQHCGPPSSP